jgi:hypothetical protein
MGHMGHIALRRIAGSNAIPRLALGIALLHLGLSLLYSLVIPPWEGVDEWSHYKFAEYVALNRALPNPGQRLTTEYETDQATQPPLYYLLTAVAIAPVAPTDNFKLEVNPYAQRGGGRGGAIGGANFAMRNPALERFPWQGTVLALHVARLVSVLLGTLALWPTYALGRFLFPRAPALALGAMAFQAFLPQYVYMGSIVHNDILVALVGGVVLYQAVQAVFGPVQLRALVILAWASALLVWSKASGLALLPVAALALLVGLIRLARRPDNRRRLIPISFGLVAVLMLLIGLWAGRNFFITGKVFPRFSNWPLEILYWIVRQPSLVAALHWDALPHAWPSLPFTFWGMFGWENIPTFPWFYPLCNYLALAALAGVLLQFALPRPEPARGGILLLLLAGAGVMLLAIYRVLVFQGGLPGRYLFPALAGLSILFVTGLARLLPGKIAMAAITATGLTFALVSLASLYVHIRPAYALPAPLSPADIPAEARPLRARLGNVVELVAYELGSTEVHPGEALQVTFYWRVLARTPDNYTLGIHILGPNLEDYGELNTYPGQGRLATSRWEPGTLFRETAWVVARPTGPLPSLGRVSVALFPSDTPLEGLPAFDEQGQPLGGSIIFGRLRLSPKPEQRATPPPLTQPVDFAFGPEGNIHLRSAKLSPAEPPFIGSTLTLTLTWQSVNPLPAGQDVHVFVHLLDKEGNIARQTDAPPGGELLPTGIWRAGDWVTSTHRLRLIGLSDGEYRLAIGLYRPESGERLGVRDAAGQEQRDKQVILRRWHLPPSSFTFLPLTLHEEMGPNGAPKRP